MLLCCHINDDVSLLKRAMDISFPQRRQKAEGMKHEGGKAASIAAGLLLKYGLRCCGVTDAEIIYTEHGKPCLADSRFFFSLSHSGEYAACIIDEKAVGVDIQKIVPVSQRAVTRFCTISEQAYLKHSPNVERDIIRLWALKESWLKAAEKGPAQMFEASFVLHANGKVDGPEEFSYQLFEDIPEYIIAVCQCR